MSHIHSRSLTFTGPITEFSKWTNSFDKFHQDQIIDHFFFGIMQCTGISTNQNITHNYNLPKFFRFILVPIYALKWTWNEREMNVNEAKSMSQVHSRSWSFCLVKFEPDSRTELNWTWMNGVLVHFFPSLTMIIPNK